MLVITLYLSQNYKLFATNPRVEQNMRLYLALGFIWHYLQECYVSNELNRNIYLPNSA